MDKFPKIFSAADFELQDDGKFPELTELAKGLAVKYAQARFEAWLKEQPMLFSSSDMLWARDVSQSKYGYTHTARLVCVEEIKKEPCTHEPSLEQRMSWNDPITCKHCGVKLVARWEEAE